MKDFVNKKFMKSADITADPLFIMLGGFMGAGKTTTLLRLAQHFQRQGRKVGIITNDQAEGLVDTALVEQLNLPVREIAGGCFCCRSESLLEALARLTEESQPEVFIAEPVGSCTDLVATVSLPLERIYKTGFRMAPYAVLVDPYRAIQILRVEDGEPVFSPDISYIFRKQLEEAEIIVINKADVVKPARMERLHEAMTREYPGAQIMVVSSRDGTGLEPLFEALMQGLAAPRRIMEMDYERYGKGEALLGWYNGKADVKARKPQGVDGNRWLIDLASRIRSVLRTANVEIAHFKMTLSAGDANSGKTAGGLAAVSLVRTDGEPEIRRELNAPLSKGNLIINLRAEGAPELLATVVQEALKASIQGVSAKLKKEEAFRPGQPTPTHRVAAV
jgi:G3E family GTPase